MEVWIVKMDCGWCPLLRSSHRSWLLSWSLIQFLCSLEDRGHFRTLVEVAMFPTQHLFLSVSITTKHFFHCRIHKAGRHCSDVPDLSALFSPRSLNLIMSGNGVTCIKLHLFTTDWTWTYDCSPVLYHSTSLSVNLFWNSNCKAFGKSTFFVFKRNIDVFSL